MTKLALLLSTIHSPKTTTTHPIVSQRRPSSHHHISKQRLLRWWPHLRSYAQSHCFRSRTFPTWHTCHYYPQQLPCSGTIQNIPLVTSDFISMVAMVGINSTSSAKYVILLHNNTTTESTFEDLLKVGSPKTDSSTPTVNPSLGLHHFLKDNSKLTIYYQGSLHKG